MAFLIIFGVSLIAVIGLIGLAGWARIARPTARALLAEEFPSEPLGEVWITADGAGAIGRAGDKALVLVRVGDGYAARRLAWSMAYAGRVADGRLVLPGDVATPVLRLALGALAWPPPESAA